MRRAFVTGASTGIGEAVAMTLGQQGYEVALAGRNMSELTRVANRLETDGHRGLAVALDLRDMANIRDALDEAWRRLGPCDVLINCGASTVRKNAVDVLPEEWDDVVNTNLKGAYFLACRFAERLIGEQRPGRIVNIGSTHGLIAFNRLSVYGISKAGLHHLTRMLAVEWAEHGIRVNAVAPGTTETPARREILSDPANRKRMLDRIPLHRFLSAHEVADAVVYLVSPSAGSLTGHVLVLDGGLTIY